MTCYETLGVSSSEEAFLFAQHVTSQAAPSRYSPLSADGLSLHNPSQPASPSSALTTYCITPHTPQYQTACGCPG
jgi:hypothetical protein